MCNNLILFVTYFNHMTTIVMPKCRWSWSDMPVAYLRSIDLWNWISRTRFAKYILINTKLEESSWSSGCFRDFQWHGYLNLPLLDYAYLLQNLEGKHHVSATYSNFLSYGFVRVIYILPMSRAIHHHGKGQSTIINNTISKRFESRLFNSMMTMA